MIYGLPPDETLDSAIAKAKAKRLSAYAFLRNRRWCENERLGFFGMATKSECQIKAEEEGKSHEGRCIHEDSAKFYDRFINDLSPETILVGVDYHV
jgi:hypothetical protein